MSPAEPRASRLYALDLLRFSAAMAVVGVHLVADIGRRGAWGDDPAQVFGSAVSTPLEYGWMGVEFFFIISGFVICMSCWGRPLSQFFVSRVTRLMPAYLFAVLLVGAVLTIAPVQHAPEPSDILVNLTMLQGFVGVPGVDDVYWTLFVELKFYLLFAVVVGFGVTYRRVVLFNVIWTVLYLFARLVKLPALTALVEPTFAPYFIAGTTLYLIYRFGPNLLLWCMLGVSIAMAIPSVHGRSEGLVRLGLVSYKVALVVMFAMFAVMILLALGRLSWLRWPGLATLGVLTYPVYLLHRQLGWVAVDQLHEVVPAWPLLLAIVAAVLGLAWLAHRLVERPLARLIRRGLTTSLGQIRSADLADEIVRSAGRLPTDRNDSYQVRT